MKNHIKAMKNEVNLSFLENHQTKWEFMKFEIRKFTMSYSKMKARNIRERKQNLEKKNSSFRTKY